MDLLKNISVNLRAAGPAAVACVWLISMVVLGLYGTGPYAGLALGIIAFSGVGIIAALSRNPQE
jgi:hypothetical protein